MPKRWKVVSTSSNWGYQLLDKQGGILHSSALDWQSKDSVDQELDEILNGDIEFPDTPGPKRPKHHRKQTSP